MKKNLLLVLLAILSVHGYSQIVFEKGYFIDNSDQKTECLIKNIDWKNNPIDFEYKFSEEGEIFYTTIDDVKEFGIDNVSKFIRANVEIDKSSEKINDLSYEKNAVFVKEKLFLKTLVEGKYNLYIYNTIGLERFFYSTDSISLEQLIYKSYTISENKIGKNNKYKQQIWSNLKCPSITMSELERLEYKRKSLTDFFVKFNVCNDSKFENYNTKVKKDLFNLNLRLHLNNTSLNNSIILVENSYYYNPVEIDLGNDFGFSIGAEAEFILPFNKNKWGLIIEPKYQRFKSENTKDVNFVSGRKLTTTIDYKSLEIPIGIRYYFHINEKSKIFINASYEFDISFNSSIQFKRTVDNSDYGNFEILTSNNLATGIGYKFMNKYSLEVRYHTPRNLNTNYTYFDSKFNKLSFILGYTLF